MYIVMTEFSLFMIAEIIILDKTIDFCLTFKPGLVRSKYYVNIYCSQSIKMYVKYDHVFLIIKNNFHSQTTFESKEKQITF